MFLFLFFYFSVVLVLRFLALVCSGVKRFVVELVKDS